MPTVDNEQATLYYETHGDPANKALVFAHGAGGNAASWWQQVPAFRDDYFVITFDHRMFGRSTCPPEAMSAVQFDGDLMAILDACNVKKAAVVCQSMGGWTGLRAAVNFPDRVSCLLLGNTPGAIKNPVVAENFGQMAERLRKTPLTNAAVSQGFNDRDPDHALLYLQIAAFNPPRPADMSLNRDNALITITPDSGYNVPTLVLASDEDPLFPADMLKAAAEQIGADYVLVEGAGHSTYFEMPEEFNRVTREFLTRHW